MSLNRLQSAFVDSLVARLIESSDLKRPTATRASGLTLDPTVRAFRALALAAVSDRPTQPTCSPRDTPRGRGRLSNEPARALPGERQVCLSVDAGAFELVAPRRFRWRLFLLLLGLPFHEEHRCYGSSNSSTSDGASRHC